VATQGRLQERVPEPVLVLERVPVPAWALVRVLARARVPGPVRVPVWRSR
jgi:hypothetical protein